MTTTQATLSQAGVEKITALAKQAAKTDNWMRPSHDGEATEDYGDFAQEHRGQWESTDHFGTFWNEQIVTISEDDAEAQGIFRIDDGETWLHGFYVEAKEAFWEAWEGEVGLHAYWKKVKN